MVCHQKKSGFPEEVLKKFKKNRRPCRSYDLKEGRTDYVSQKNHSHPPHDPHVSGAPCRGGQPSAVSSCSRNRDHGGPRRRGDRLYGRPHRLPPGGRQDLLLCQQSDADRVEDPGGKALLFYHRGQEPWRHEDRKAAPWRQVVLPGSRFKDRTVPDRGQGLLCGCQRRPAERLEDRRRKEILFHR